MIINPSDAAPEKKSIEELEQEIKAAQAEHAAVVEAQKKSKQEFEATVGEYKETNASNAFDEAIRKTGIAFHASREDVRTLLTDKNVGGYSVEFSNDGKHCLVKDRDGRPVDSVESALEQLVRECPYLAEHTQHLTQRDPQSGQFQTLAKSDFANAAQRSRFIEREGLARFEALPLRHEKVTPLHSMTAAEYSRLSPAQKSQIIRDIGEDGLSMILKRK